MSFDPAIPGGIFIIGGEVVPAEYDLAPAIVDAQAFYFLYAISLDVEKVIVVIAIRGKGIGNVDSPFTTGNGDPDLISSDAIVLRTHGEPVAGIFIGNKPGAAAGVATEAGSRLPAITDDITAGNRFEVYRLARLHRKIGAEVNSGNAAYCYRNPAGIIGTGIVAVANYLVGGGLLW